LQTLGLQSLLGRLAELGHRGLCVLTTQQDVTDLNEYIRSKDRPMAGVILHKLDHLSDADGARLLHRLGVTRAGDALIKDTDEELVLASHEVHGHALTLSLLGNYLKRAYAGDIRQRHLVRFIKADEGNTFRMLAAWEKWFTSGGNNSVRQLTALRLMGLFNGPADTGCLSALLRKPAIPGLTESLVGLTEEDWNVTLSYLEESDLIAIQRDESGKVMPRPSVNCHALIRQYFADQLLDKNKEAFNAAHRRLYEYLAKTPNRSRATLNDLLPLYEAVTHACMCGRAQEAYDEIYIGRINRGSRGHNGYYASEKLGAYNADFVALNCFFEKPWEKFVAGINEETKVEILSRAARLLQFMGRVDEVYKPLLYADKLLSARRKNNWHMRARIASQQAVQAYRAGDMSEAVRKGEQATRFAGKSSDIEVRIASYLCYAYALFLAGKRPKALSILQRADKMNRPFGWFDNYRVFELLSANAELISWLRFMHAPDVSKSVLEGAKASIDGAKQRLNRIISPKRASKLSERDNGIYHITLGRLALYAGQCSDSADRLTEIANARVHIDAAASHLGSSATGLRPIYLESRAWLRMLDGNDRNNAQSDLDEAWRIANRGSMVAHKTDILLYRARLFYRTTPYLWQDSSPAADLAEARRFIQDCGYWRRKNELEDAERMTHL
jgi:tetratricopeptide (TPR) repeat protein